MNTCVHYHTPPKKLGYGNWVKKWSKEVSINEHVVIQTDQILSWKKLDRQGRDWDLKMSILVFVSVNTYN